MWIEKNQTQSEEYNKIINQPPLRVVIVKYTYKKPAGSARELIQLTQQVAVCARTQARGIDVDVETRQRQFLEKGKLLHQSFLQSLIAPLSDGLRS